MYQLGMGPHSQLFSSCQPVVDFSNGLCPQEKKVSLIGGEWGGAALVDMRINIWNAAGNDSGERKWQWYVLL